MTPEAFRAARDTLGLTQDQFATVLGYGHKMRVSEVERGIREAGPAVVRLVQAYLDGYRPADWPVTKSA